MRHRATSGGIVLAALLASACDAARGEEATGGESWDLFHGLHDADHLEIEVAPGPAQVRAAQLAEHLALSAPLEVRLCEPGTDSDRDAARVLVGACGDPRLLRIAQHCGVEALEGGGFRVLGREFRDPSAALVAAFADPERPRRDGRPLVLFLGNDQEQLAAHMRSIPRPWKPYLRVYAEGELELACPLRPDGTPLADRAIDYGARFREYWKDAKRVEARGFAVLSREAVDMNRWQRYLKQIFEASAQVASWLGRGDEREIELLVYPEAEDMERCLGEVDLALVNPLRPRVHVLFSEGIPHDGGRGVAGVRARGAGMPVSEWMEDGVAVAATGEWWREELVPWFGFLDAAGLVPPLAEIVDPRAGERVSEHVLMPARGFLFEVLAQKLGKDKVRAAWAGADLDLAALEPDFQAARKAALAAARPLIERSGKIQTEVKAARFRNGIALLDEHGELRSSYASRAFESTLDHLAALEHAPDSVSLTVFASGEDPAAPLVTLAPRAVSGSASDVALANAAARVRERRMRLTLVLQPLSSPGGTWADGGLLARPAVESAFWERTRRLVVHYALLAELLRAEIFCMGANMGEASRTWPLTEGPAQEVNQRKLAAWRELIGTVRKVFSGGLTYGARFPSEAWTVAFWEDLDYVGIEFYPRWAGSEEQPSAADLERIVRFDMVQSVALGIRWNRPVLLLEVGFPSRSSSWASPWIPHGALDLEEQRRYFESCADVLGRGFENAAMLHGLFLWNWHVDPARGGPLDAGFALQGKPVESVLPRIYAR